MKIAIVGTAGRRGDREMFSVALYKRTYEYIELMILNRIGLLSPDKDTWDGSEVTLNLGGAAYMDHVGVSLLKKGTFTKAELHLPSALDQETHRYVEDPSRGIYDPGKVSNRYHDQFATKLGAKPPHTPLWSLCELALKFPTHYYTGFHQRNIGNGKCDWIIAGCFSPDPTHPLVSHYTKEDPGWSDGQLAGLKDGGTSHCWVHSQAKLKTFINLHRL